MSELTRTVGTALVATVTLLFLLWVVKLGTEPSEAHTVILPACTTAHANTCNLDIRPAHGYTAVTIDGQTTITTK